VRQATVQLAAGRQAVSQSYLNVIALKAVQVRWRTQIFSPINSCSFFSKEPIRWFGVFPI
jgi:hypothetical protein